jgi:hypothetical protein
VLRDLTEFPDWLAAATLLDGRLASVADSARAARTAHSAREAAGECETIISGA